MSTVEARYPRFYRGPRFLKTPAPEGSSSKESSAPRASSGASASSRPRRSVAPKDETEHPNGLSSPSRPRRQRTRPELFTEYRQVNEEIDGKKIKARERSSFREKDPYDGNVFWAKMTSHPPWPSVKMNSEEISILESVDGLSMARERTRFGNVPCVAVTFLGSNNKAIVKESDVFGFCNKYDAFTKKKLGKQFALGLEKADEVVLRILAEQNESSDCVVCDKSILGCDSKKAHLPPAVLCERCLTSAHTSCCTKSGELVNGFENDRPHAWFCSACIEEAPVTLKARKESEERMMKRKRKANGISVGNSKQTALARNSSTASTNSASSVGPVSKKQKKGGSDTNGVSSVAPKPEPKAPNLPVIFKNPDDISDDFCYVCKDGGTLVICDYPGCRRAYHKYCLNHEAFNDDDDDDDDQPWHCPWHCCAECGDCERPVVANPPNKTSSNSGSSSSSSNSNVPKVLPMPTVPDPNRIRAPNAQKDKDDALPAKPKVDTPSTPTLIGTTTSGFLHCVSCPLALCAKHSNIKRPVYFNSTTVMPYSIDRANRKGYFKCEHCSGVQMRSRYQERQPNLVLSTFLHRVWSRIVNGHEHMCKLFLCKIGEIDVPKGAMDTFNALRKHRVTNMMEVRNKVWKLEYTSEAAFRADIEHVAKLSAAVFGTSSPIIAETAQSLPLIMEQAFRSLRSTLKDEDFDENLLKAQLGKGGNIDRPFRSGCLNPSVLMKRPGEDAGVSSAAVAKSSSEWNNLLTNTSFKSGQTLEQPQEKPARDEAKGIVASLVAAAESIGGFENHLPPSKASLDEMLEQQSLVLRSALRSTACLRDAVKKTFQRFDAGVGDQVGKNDVTLGEMRLAAEYKLVISSLKAKNSQLMTMLALERQARQEAEKKIKELESN